MLGKWKKTTDNVFEIHNAYCTNELIKKQNKKKKKRQTKQFDEISKIESLAEFCSVA